LLNARKKTKKEEGSTVNVPRPSLPAEKKRGTKTLGPCSVLTSEKRGNKLKKNCPGGKKSAPKTFDIGHPRQKHGL